MSLEDFKIFEHVASVFDDMPIENLDFKRHLKHDVAVVKKIHKLPNGRPEKAEYYLNNIKVAEINFIFESNEDNLLTSRKEILNYIKNDDTKSMNIVIKHQEFDYTNTSDIEHVFKERESARSSIIIDIKGAISGVMQTVLGYSMPKVLQIGKSFSSEYGDHISDFIEFGSPNFKNALSTLDVQNSNYAWLLTPVDINGTTLKDLIILKLSY